MHDNNFYGFAQNKSKEIGHWALIELLQYPNGNKLIFTTIGVFFIGILACMLTSFSLINIAIVFIVTLVTFFVGKTYRAMKILKPFKIPLWGNFEKTLLQTVFISEINDNEKKLFSDLLAKNMAQQPHLVNYNFITMTNSKAKNLMNGFIHFDEIQSCINLRLAREAREKQE